MIKKRLNDQAFTLVEILVVITVISIVGVIITEIFFNTLKGSNKSSLITKIKQNGQTALESMDKDIRNADHVLCPIISSGVSASSNILVIEKDRRFTRFSLIEPSEANSYLAVDYPIAFDNSLCENPDPSAINLTDKNLIKVIQNVNGEKIFTRNKPASFNDVVSIEFLVAPGFEVTSSLSSQIDPVPFATSIQIR